MVIENKYDITSLESEINWFTEVLNTRLKLYFSQECQYKSIREIIPPSQENKQHPYCVFVRENNCSAEDRIFLMLSVIPVLKPQLFDCLMIKNSDTDNRFTEFGCVKGNQHNGLLPTLETLLFILAAEDFTARIYYLSYFRNNHFLLKRNLISLENQSFNEPFPSSMIAASPELLEMVLRGEEYSPDLSFSFPAKKITTGQGWTDLVLDSETLQLVEEIITWVEYGDELHAKWGLGKKIKPGYRCLFYGASGTGKTLTAALIGSLTGMEVFRIDLSMVLSKYIGETEKNLSKVFDWAEYRNVIIFIDEADSVIGKRFQTKDSNDFHANHTVGFLLQRIEDYDGLVILATNFKSNIDDAFARRFQSVINFPVPKTEEREKLWLQTFSPQMKLADDINMKEIAKKYEITGGAILNVVRYCSLMALKRKSDLILLTDLKEGIKREFQKEGKTV